MLFTTSTFALVAAIGFASAAPTPTSDSSAAATSTCTTVWPVVLEDIWEGTPQHIAYNTLPQDASDPDQGNFGMGATWNGTAWTSREYTYASFDIPAEAQKCALWSSFPPNVEDYEVLEGGLDPQVQTYGPSVPFDSSDLTFWDVFPQDSAPNVDEFMAATLRPGTDTLLGAFDCPSGSTAEFIMGIANLTGVPEGEFPVYSFRVNNTAPRNYGLYVTYGVETCFSSN